MSCELRKRLDRRQMKCSGKEYDLKRSWNVTISRRILRHCVVSIQPTIREFKDIVKLISSFVYHENNTNRQSGVLWRNYVHDSERNYDKDRSFVTDRVSSSVLRKNDLLTRTILEIWITTPECLINIRVD